jgi:para-nitrobenzyl esterase
MIIGLLGEDMWPHTLYTIAAEWGRLMANANLGPVYGYYFDRQLPGSDDGAWHGCDLRYAFGTLDTSWRPFDEIDFRISRDMMDCFASFAAGDQPAPAPRKPWEPITQDSCRFYHFGDEPCTMVDVPEDRLQATQAKGKNFPTL